MDSYQETRRQFRLALVLLGTILPVGVIGFMVLEGLDALNSFYLTIVTLTTIGYGDVVAVTPTGRLFTVVLIIAGVGTVGFALQALVLFYFSPESANVRRRRQAYRIISQMQNHYIVAGEGELVSRTIELVMRRAEIRQAYQQAEVTSGFDRVLDRIFGRHNIRMRPARRFLRWLYLLPSRSRTLLDAVVVITQDVDYARELRRSGILVIEGDSSDDRVLRLANLKKAHALMALSASDTETLLTTLAAHNRRPDLMITASVHEDTFVSRMLRVGANNIIRPYEVAGQFLNNATFRPAVNDFFNTILFEQNRSGVQAVQLFLYDDSPWIGKTLADIDFRIRFHAGVIGIRQDNGNYIYAPPDDYVLQEDEVVLAVATPHYLEALQRACHPGQPLRRFTATWQRLPAQAGYKQGEHEYTLDEAAAAAGGMASHYIICAGGYVAEGAIDKLDPKRPFVIISEYDALTAELLKRGFRVIHGNPAEERVLVRAGIERALAIMISLPDGAQSVLTTLSSRTLNRQILITATADNDEMITKLRRAGADRVISPFRLAARFVLLTTTRPVVSDFLQYVLYNDSVKLETTELYMQDDSPWIGKPLADLYLRRIFAAGVLGIRAENGRYLYAPPDTHVIRENEILIVTVPMHKSDLLREVAHGSVTRRPRSIRQNDVLKTSFWL